MPAAAAAHVCCACAMDGTGTPPATEARLLPVLQALAAREPLFHRPEQGTPVQNTTGNTA
ncbi:hypothetical protein [Streptomyces albofaciens]|uniref:hypothetical protein n=1 Tax=Streptomyces albofaciens TaxID=66866 RepID=UPI00123AD72B|nr:hypothetical protein [Streptomyces albofaciens]